MSESDPGHSPVAEAAGEAAADAADEVIQDASVAAAAETAAVHADDAQAVAGVAADMALDAGQTAAEAQGTAEDAGELASEAAQTAGAVAEQVVEDHGHIQRVLERVEALDSKFDAFVEKHYKEQDPVPEVTEVEVGNGDSLGTTGQATAGTSSSGNPGPGTERNARHRFGRR